MKKIMLVVCMLFVAVFMFAQTEVASGNVSGVWNATGSPYNINGEITIIAGETLSITEGVTVNFTDHYQMIVNGQLLVNEVFADSSSVEDAQMVTFTATDTDAGWGGIRFVQTLQTTYYL